MKELLSIFLGGEQRVVVPALLYPAIMTIPASLLALLVIIPNDRLSSKVKQILSIPLLTAVFFGPFGFTMGNRVIDLVGACACYNFFLRLFELFWSGPLVQNRPVYATVESLWIDFWSCLRTFPKPAKEDTKELKKGQVQEYKKDKKFYHIIAYLLAHMIIVDISAAYICSFTTNESVEMSSERPVLFFFFFFVVNIVLNSAFNSLGYGLHLFYCLAFEGGSYSSEQWRSLMINPILSSSLDDLWSYRWHSLFKSTWLSFPFRPVRILTVRFLTKKVKNPKPIAFLLASISVFVASALMHEYVVAANLGWPIYNRFFKGEQCIFFVGHGVGVFFENLVKIIVAPKLSKEFKESALCRALRHLWVVAFGYFTFYYIMNGFLSWGFHYDNPLTFTKPYLYEYVRAHPAVQPYFGSLVY